MTSETTLLCTILVGLAACGSDDNGLVADAAPDTPAMCKPGALDPAFGTAGFVSAPPSGYAIGVRPGPNGTLLVAMIAPSNNGDACTVMRVTPGGRLDPTFGTNGIARVPVPGRRCSAYAVDVQSDGKIILAGSSATTAADTQRLLARLTPAGTLDTSFGSQGLVLDTAGDPAGEFNDVAIDAQDRIVTGGYGRDTSSTLYIGHLRVQRFLPGGSPDTTFGTAGTAPSGFSSMPSRADNVVALASGAVVAVGLTTPTSIAVERIDATGALDATFGTAGSLNGGSTQGYANEGVAVDSAGNIMLVGNKAIVRLTASGAVDPAFTAPSLPPGLSLNRVAIAPSGMFVAIGTSGDGMGTAQMAVVRFSATGALDTEFGTGGVAKTPLGETTNGAELTVQPDGAIVGVGMRNSAAAIARFCP